MSESPLKSLHVEAAASFIEIDGTSIPSRFDSADKEAARARAGACITDLAHIGTASLEGPDARRFSNGMFTNNIRDLQEGSCNRSAMCDDRGRVQGLIDVYCTRDDRFDIVLEGVTPDWFEERYGLYIVFDDVEMNVSGNGPWILSVQGPDSAEILAKAGLPMPQAGLHITTDTGVRVARKDRTGLGGFDLIVPTEAAESTWTALINAGAAPMGHDAMEILRIRAGMPQWPADGTEKTLVHELGLEKEVCNFNNGCYLGQEVINRVDVTGQDNKRLERIVMAPSAGHTGAAVQIGDDTVGTISSITHGAENSVALAVLRKAAWDADHVNIQTDSGPIRGTIDRS